MLLLQLRSKSWFYSFLLTSFFTLASCTLKSNDKSPDSQDSSIAGLNDKAGARDDYREDDKA
jgi:hypothetical protein